MFGIWLRRVHIVVLILCRELMVRDDEKDVRGVRLERVV